MKNVPSAQNHRSISLHALSDVQLKNAENNLAARGVAVCPFYSLRELRFERFHRQMKCMDGARVVGIILSISATSPDGYVTYNQLNRALWDKTLDGPGSVARLMRAMGAAILHCVKNKLPIVTALVTKEDRTYSENALRNLADTARYLGEDVDSDARSYVYKQALLALMLVRGTAIEEVA